MDGNLSRIQDVGCFVPLPSEKPRTEASDAMQWGFEVMDIDFVPPGGHHFVECNKVLVQKLIVPLHNLAKGNGSDDRREDFARILYETMETFQAMGMSICDIDRVLSFATHPLLMLACDVLRDCFPYVVDFFMELRSVWKAGAFALIGSKIHAVMLAKGYFETDGFTGFTKLCEWSLTFAVGDPFPIVGGAPVGQMFKWKKNFDKSGVDAPPRSIVGTRLNLERLEEYTCGLLDELLSDHMVLAGGILMKTLCGKDYGTSDLDLWFVGLTELDQVLAELDRAMSVYSHMNEPVPVPWVGQSWRSNVEKYIELSDPAKRMYGSREVYNDLAAIGQAMQVSADFVNSIMAMSS
ncbi:hypothetical protein TSOC_000500 [Tetrabaena socialis]|uniref:Uncharacterized protein n=1 Tax=Tetrabaena socialis TaxID=47790 RepID=A0A2J8AJ47_9CHLO|nr:hypothetical protein TSOC_000500 [Tetrabaena socialis]|eukprot:PNH12539.1 hypothetical protein TSOC_000500 [Tetrabaena socialis]